MTFSVTTVTDWGMSRSSWLPLPMVELVARNDSRHWGASADYLIVTVPSVLLSSAVCAQPVTEAVAASIMVPKGNMAPRAAWVDEAADTARTLVWCIFL